MPAAELPNEAARKPTPTNPTNKTPQHTDTMKTELIDNMPDIEEGEPWPPEAGPVIEEGEPWPPLYRNPDEEEGEPCDPDDDPEP